MKGGRCFSRRTDERVCVPERVWYAAYGSNLCARRFRCYLRGESATARHKRHAGCRDSSDARRWVLGVVEHGVVFSRYSEAWGGGVAFLDAEPESGLSWVRLWDVTREQFEDISAMENGLEPGAVLMDWARFVRAGGSEIGGSGWYRQGVYLGDYEGAPVVTFTGDASLPWAEPGEAYVSVILEGLRECGLGEVEVVDYSRRWGI